MTPPSTVHLRGTKDQRILGLVVAILVLSATCALVFGPARGARNDIGEVRDDLDVSRQGIFETVEIGRTNLAKVTRQLRITRTSLEVQQQGLRIAGESQDIARTGVRTTERIEQQTSEALTTLRRVIRALGPLQELRGDVETVVTAVEAGVSLARTTLDVARQTLTDGRRALAIAADTLSTLERSEQVQTDLLQVARETLEEVREINRKIPGLPVFPTTP